MRRFLPFAALLGVAFVLGCQDVGTGPDGLVPQFDKKGLPGTDCDGVEGGPERDLSGHCHVNELDTEFLVTMVSNVFNFSEGASQGLLIQFLTLDLSFFNEGTGCDLGNETGTFSLIKGDADGPHVHINFSFTDANGVQHSLGMDGVPVAGIDDNEAWDPTLTRTAEESPGPPSGPWGIKAKGRGHQNGCNAEGDGLEFLITVEPRTP